MLDHEKYMRAALGEAGAAAAEGEVPVGAVAVLEGEIIAHARNRKESENDATAHAEMILLKNLSRRLGRWRLTGVTVYVTLEPCPMCVGAMVLSRIDRLVYGADDPKMGAVRTLYSIADDDRLNHSIEVVPGVMADECGEVLSYFFRGLRAKDKGSP